MDQVARLPLGARRWQRFGKTLRLIGVDLTGADMRLQVRLHADAPGTPLLDLGTVTNGNAQGLRLLPVEQVGGKPVSTVSIQINETTIETLPFTGLSGDDTVLAYDLQIDPVGGYKAVWVEGEFWVLAAVTGADGAPSVAVGADGVERRRPMFASGASSFQIGDTIVGIEIAGGVGPQGDKGDTGPALIEYARRFEGVATAGQTVFDPGFAFTPTLATVSINGDRLQSKDYDASSGTTVTLAAPALAGDEIILDLFQLPNAAIVTSAVRLEDIPGAVPIDPTASPNSWVDSSDAISAWLDQSAERRAEALAQTAEHYAIARVIRYATGAPEIVGLNFHPIPGSAAIGFAGTRIDDQVIRNVTAHMGNLVGATAWTCESPVNVIFDNPTAVDLMGAYSRGFGFDVLRQYGRHSTGCGIINPQVNANVTVAPTGGSPQDIGGEHGWFFTSEVDPGFPGVYPYYDQTGEGAPALWRVQDGYVQGGDIRRMYYGGTRSIADRVVSENVHYRWTVRGDQAQNGCRDPWRRGNVYEEFLSCGEHNAFGTNGLILSEACTWRSGMINGGGMAQSYLPGAGCSVRIVKPHMEVLDRAADFVAGIPGWAIYIGPGHDGTIEIDEPTGTIGVVRAAVMVETGWDNATTNPASYAYHAPTDPPDPAVNGHNKRATGKVTIAGVDYNTRLTGIAPRPLVSLYSQGQWAIGDVMLTRSGSPSNAWSDFVVAMADTAAKTGRFDLRGNGGWQGMRAGAVRTINFPITERTGNTGDIGSDPVPGVTVGALPAPFPGASYHVFDASIGGARRYAPAYSDGAAWFDGLAGDPLAFASAFASGASTGVTRTANRVQLNPGATAGSMQSTTSVAQAAKPTIELQWDGGTAIGAGWSTVASNGRSITNGKRIVIDPTGHVYVFVGDVAGVDPNAPYIAVSRPNAAGMSRSDLVLRDQDVLAARYDPGPQGQGLVTFAVNRGAWFALRATEQVGVFKTGAALLLDVTVDGVAGQGINIIRYEAA